MRKPSSLGLLLTCTILLSAITLAACSSSKLPKEEPVAHLSYARLDTSEAIEHTVYTGVGLEEGVPAIGVPVGFTAPAPRHLVIGFPNAIDSVVAVWDPDGERLFAAPVCAGEPIEWMEAERSSSFSEPVATIFTVDVPVRVSDSLAEATIRQVSIGLRPFSTGSMMLFRMNDYRAGTIELGGTRYRVALLRSGNALSYSNPNELDVLIDLDGDGTFQRTAEADSNGVWRENESFEVNRPIVIEGRPYEIAEVDPNGSSFVLQLSQQQDAFVVGLPAPNLALQTLSGDSLRLSDLRGKFVVLNWWATGCAPCIVEMPGLNELVAQYDSSDVVFVAIADDTPEDLNEFFQDHEFDYVQALASDSVRAHLGGAYPKHIMVNEEGRVVYFETGGSARQHEVLDKAIRALMKAS